MSTDRLYHIVRQVHLYCSLATAAMLLMYIVTSYMMIYHDAFKVEEFAEDPITIKVSPKEVAEENWQQFLNKQQIKGRHYRSNFNKNGDLVKTYYSGGGESKITIFNDRNEVEIINTELNRSGKIIELHRMRGYGGPFQYNIYAFLLDIMGVSLILFAITGIVLWMKLLQHNKIAWTILVLGFIYVSAIIAYLMFV